MNRLLYTSAFVLLLLHGMKAQQSQTVTFFNKGALFVKNSLYIGGNFQAEANSEVFQQGKTVVTGNFINNVTGGHVFTSNKDKNKGSLEFRGDSTQHIKGQAAKDNYINFPATLCINNRSAKDSAVIIHSNIAATAQTVDIQRGRLILDSDPQGANASVNAHLLVENEVVNHPNAVQVNLALGDNYTKRKLAGFTPPFEVMYADYFLFNFLSRPTAKGLFGNSGRLITNPRTPLKPGLGYIIGMGVIPAGDPYYAASLDPRWADADFNKRATQKFFFSRAAAEPTFSKYLNEGNAPGYVAGEKLVTRDVDIQLEPGFNYLGNPYMAPLDLSDIINEKTAADWGIADGALKPGFYVLSQGAGSYANGRFTFSASYLIRQHTGSTANTTSVAPMQMFIVGTDKATTMKIPKNKRQHDAKAALLRSAEEEITDEILIETTDNQTGAYDRLCIVFRHDATLRSGDPYDAVKILNRSGGVNQIYTRSSDGKDMTVAVIPPSTRSLTMYFEPALQPQQVTLRADRLNSLRSVERLTLEDTRTGTLTDLRRTASYTFASSPLDKPGRFVLHFAPATTSADAITTTPNAIYTEGVTQVFGLHDIDRASDIYLFDISGRLIHRQPPSDATPCLIRKHLPQGVYIIRHNTTVIRFAVK